MKPEIDLEMVLKVYVEFRDRIHDQVTRAHDLEDSFYTIASLKLFLYAFNTYKAIALLLPEHFYEQAGVLLRTLWETGANLEWISLDPETRAKHFFAYTAVEYRHRLQRNLTNAGIERDRQRQKKLEQELAEAEDVLHEQLGTFQYKDKKGRTKWKPRFSGPSLDHVIKELGGDWLKEYEREYLLGTKYTHATPGGVLFPLDDHDGSTSALWNLERSAAIGIMSVHIMIRIYKRWLAALREEDNEHLDKLYFRVLEAVSPVPTRPSDDWVFFLEKLRKS